MSSVSPDGLVAALARAQASFAPVVKSHINPHFKSKYADLSDLLAVVRPALNAEGVWLSQPLVTDDDGRVRLFTRLEGHGEVREASLPLHLDNMTPQQLLSTLTYYRRGELASMLGVAAEDDDDGNLAATAPTQFKANSPEPLNVGGGIKADSVAAAAANPPEKPLAAMTAGEMARYGESIGIRVSGNKAEILRQLEPIVLAASGAEPFEVGGPVPGPTEVLIPAQTVAPFEPVVAGFVGAGIESGTARKQRNTAES